MTIRKQPRGDGYIAVVGLGYVGLPLAATLAAAGYRVVGVDANPRVVEDLRAGKTSFYEPGLDSLLASLPAGRFTVGDTFPETAPAAAIICVGTPTDPVTREPDTRHLRAAVDRLATAIDEQTLVVIRSTVPVGTCRNLVLPRLTEQVERPRLAFCPERIIQGAALTELVSLPQIIGGLDEDSTMAAGELFEPILPRQIRVSGLETAEMIKLVCNAHTDLIYGFGNEIAAVAEGLGLDAGEVIAAANLDYPRPDIARPGFVGGSCLVKDPHMLVHISGQAGYDAPMVRAARRVNEDVPRRAVQRVLAALATRGRAPADVTVMICGVAYKGRPETDDVRGSAAEVIAAELTGRVGRLIAHDFLVKPERMAAMGLEPTDLVDGLHVAEVVFVLTDHAGYTGYDPSGDLKSAPIVFDMWGAWDDTLSRAADVEYLRLGRG